MSNITLATKPMPVQSTTAAKPRTRGTEAISLDGEALNLVTTLRNMDIAGPLNVKTNPQGSAWISSLIYCRANEGWIEDRTTGKFVQREPNDAGLIDLFTQLKPYLKQEVLDGVTGMPEMHDPLAEKKAEFDALVEKKYMTKPMAAKAYAEFVAEHKAAVEAAAAQTTVVTSDNAADEAMGA